MEKIKVAHLTSVHSALDIRIFFKECKTLNEAGYEVVLIAPHDRSRTVDGVKIQAVPQPQNRFDRITRTGWQVYRMALNEDAHIFHIHDPELLPWARLLRLRNKQVVYDMHENFPKAVLTKPWIPKPTRRVLSFICKLCERVLTKGLYVVYAEQSYADDYPWISKSVVVMNMPTFGQIPKYTEPKYDIPTLGYIGGVTRERGASVTIEALRILKDLGYKVNWECIGPVENDFKLHLLQLIQKYGLEGIQIRGYMLPMDGLEVIARCHMGAAVLQASPNYLDSYPTKMFEYMALGVPVVVSNFPLYRGIVEKHFCGLTVNPDEPREFAEAIRWLLEHPGEARAMGERGRQAVLSNYRWEREADKLKLFYQQLWPANGEQPLAS